MNAVKHPIKRSLVFFLVPDFTMIAFATALDPLRSANRMLGYEAYKWRLASIDGRPVRASISSQRNHSCRARFSPMTRAR